jgi:hypothetical protein
MIYVILINRSDALLGVLELPSVDEFPNGLIIDADVEIFYLYFIEVLLIKKREPFYLVDKYFLADLTTNDINLFVVFSLSHQGLVQHHLILVSDQFQKMHIYALDSTFLVKHLGIELFFVNLQQT